MDFVKHVDIYLLDQCMKGNVSENAQVLDAGFGKGRNFRFLLNQGLDVVGIDPNEECVHVLKREFPNDHQRIFHSTIENFKTEQRFDFIVCNAVLHFAKNHAHFNEMFEKLTVLLAENGILFLRMTSSIGLESFLENGKEGVYQIPDGSTRYLISRNQIDDIIEKHHLKLIEPVKTVNVDNLRCMTTLVLQK